MTTEELNKLINELDSIHEKNKNNPVNFEYHYALKAIFNAWPHVSLELRSLMERFQTVWHEYERLNDGSKGIAYESKLEHDLKFYAEPTNWIQAGFINSEVSADGGAKARQVLGIENGRPEPLPVSGPGTSSSYPCVKQDTLRAARSYGILDR